MNNNVSPIPIGKIEIVGLVLFFAGVISRMLHFPFSGPITVISLATLACVYIIGAFEILIIKEGEKPYTFLNIATGFLLAIACIGILFRLMYWPFSKIHLTIAYVGLPIVFMGLYVVKEKVVFKETAKMYLLKLIRVTAFFAVAATLYSISLKTQIAIENWDDAEMARLKYKYISNQSNPQYKEEYLQYRKTKLK